MFEFKVKLESKKLPIDSDDLFDFIEANPTFCFYSNEGELFHVFYHEYAQEYLIISDDSMYCERTIRDAISRIEDNASALIVDITLFARKLTLTIE
jgi:hypothetical protein